MIPHDQIQFGIHYFARVKRSGKLAVICMYGHEFDLAVRGTDPSSSRQLLTDYEILDVALVPAYVMDELFSLNIQAKVG